MLTAITFYWLMTESWHGIFAFLSVIAWAAIIDYSLSTLWDS